MLNMVSTTTVAVATVAEVTAATAPAVGEVIMPFLVEWKNILTALMLRAATKFNHICLATLNTCYLNQLSSGSQQQWMQAVERRPCRKPQDMSAAGFMHHISS